MIVGKKLIQNSSTNLLGLKKSNKELKDSKLKRPQEMIAYQVKS